MSRVVIALILLSCSAPALAVYKCESGGKVTYSDTPCMQGASTQLPEDPAPQKKDVARAAERNAQQKKTLTALEKARHRSEAAEEKEGRRAAREAAARHKRCATLALQRKWSEEDASRAAGKAVEKARLKARRAGERYDVECKGV